MHVVILFELLLCRPVVHGMVVTDNGTCFVSNFIVQKAAGNIILQRQKFIDSQCIDTPTHA